MNLFTMNLESKAKSTDLINGFEQSQYPILIFSNFILSLDLPFQTLKLIYHWKQ